MSKVILDASAALALLHRELGYEAIESVSTDAAISAVNLAEVASKLSDIGAEPAAIEELLAGLGLEVVPFDAEIAYRSARLRKTTRKAGLSLGDRACLATAGLLGLIAWTTDQNWRGVSAGVKIHIAR